MVDRPFLNRYFSTFQTSSSAWEEVEIGERGWLGTG